MRKYKKLYLTAAITLTLGTLMASGFIMEEAKLVSIPFYVATAVLGYSAYAIYKWGKKPTFEEETTERIQKACSSISSTDARRKAEHLQVQLIQIQGIYKRNADALLAANNVQALQHLLELYIRLTITQVDINVGATNTEDSLRRHYQDYINDNMNIADQIRELQADLKQNKYSEQTLESKKATLSLLARRWKTQERREELNREILADMERIEAQFDLALESAALKPVAISASIKVASDLMLSDISKESDGSLGQNDSSKYEQQFEYGIGDNSDVG